MFHQSMFSWLRISTLIVLQRIATKITSSNLQIGLKYFIPAHPSSWPTHISGPSSAFSSTRSWFFFFWRTDGGASASNDLIGVKEIGRVRAWGWETPLSSKHRRGQVARGSWGMHLCCPWAPSLTDLASKGWVLPRWWVASPLLQPMHWTYCLAYDLFIINVRANRRSLSFCLRWSYILVHSPFAPCSSIGYTTVVIFPPTWRDSWRQVPISAVWSGNLASVNYTSHENEQMSDHYLNPGYAADALGRKAVCKSPRHCLSSSLTTLYRWQGAHDHHLRYNHVHYHPHWRNIPV